MTTINTVAFLTQCLRVNIPIYQKLCGIDVSIPRVTLYKTTLIELICGLSEGKYYTPLTKTDIKQIIATTEDLIEKQRSDLLNIPVEAESDIPPEVQEPSSDNPTEIERVIELSDIVSATDTNVNKDIILYSSEE